MRWIFVIAVGCAVAGLSETAWAAAGDRDSSFGTAGLVVGPPDSRATEVTTQGTNVIVSRTALTPPVATLITSGRTSHPR